MRTSPRRFDHGACARKVENVASYGRKADSKTCPAKLNCSFSGVIPKTRREAKLEVPVLIRGGVRVEDAQMPKAAGQ